MFTVLSNTRNSNLYLIAAFVTAMVILLTIAFAPAISVPQPVLPVISRSDAGSDYYQRHPELNVLTVESDLTGDFALRHQNGAGSLRAAIPVTGNFAASDYFERHPELRTANPTVDLSDYFLRH